MTMWVRMNELLPFLHNLSHSFLSLSRLLSRSITALWTWCSSLSPSLGKFQRYRAQRLFAQLGHNLISWRYSQCQQPKAVHLTPSNSGSTGHLFNRGKQRFGATATYELDDLERPGIFYWFCVKLSVKLYSTGKSYNLEDNSYFSLIP